MNVVELRAPRLIFSCSVKLAASGMHFVFCGSFIRLLAGAASMAPDEVVSICEHGDQLLYLRGSSSGPGVFGGACTGQCCRRHVVHCGEN